MPITSTDLDFILKVSVNTADVNRELDDLATRTGQLFDVATYKLVDALRVQREELQRINQLMDPTLLKERLRLEREIAAARKEVAAAEHRDQVAAGGSLGYIFQQLFSKNSRKSGAMLGGILGGEGGGGMLGELGGSIGAILGGPGGAEIGSAVAKAIPKILAAPIDTVVGLLKTAGDAFSALRGPLGSVGAALKIASDGWNLMASAVKAVPIFGELLGPMLDALGKVPQIVGQITETFLSFTQKASPGQFKLFQLALDDTQGVLGHALLPFLRQFTELIRTIGSLLATAMSNISPSEMQEAIAPLKEVTQMLRDMGPTLVPQIKHFFLAIVSIISQFIQWGINFVVNARQTLKNTFAGIGGGFGGPLGAMAGNVYGTAIGNALFGQEGAQYKGPMVSDWGAAARPTKFQDFGGYEKEFQASAFSQGGLTTKQIMTNILEKVGNIVDAMTGGKIVDIDKIVNAIRGGNDPNGAGAAVNDNNVNWGAGVGAIVGVLGGGK